MIVQSIYKGLIEVPRPPLPDEPLETPAGYIHGVIGRMAWAAGYTYWDVVGPRRNRSLAYLRHEISWTLRQIKLKGGKPRFSYPHIGRILGNRDHTSILYGVRAHEARMAKGGRIAA